MKEIWNVNISIVVFSYSCIISFYFIQKSSIILLIATIILFL